MSKIEFEIKGIGNLIKGNKLFVPPYQRSFAWKELQVSQLLDDIDNNLSEEEYFLGTIVLSKEENSKLEIIDGQQRIATIVIFFAALKIFLDDQKAMETIQTDYLSEYDMRDKDNIPKLELNLQDNEFFKSFIIDSYKSKEIKKESHKRIKDAFELSGEKIKKLLSQNNDDINILYDWREFINEKLQSVIITVPTDANAFTIFETLNDRGLELAQIDLLKNYLYSKAGIKRLEEAQSSWLELIAKIEEESLTLTYIKHYWASINGFIRVKNKELYNEIKNKKRTSTEVIAFIGDLKNDVDRYKAILNHNSAFWNDYDNKCREFIETLNYFSLEQYRPLLISILKNFTNDEVANSLKLILSWLVRNLITGRMGGGALEQAYANKAKEISDGNVKDAKNLKEALKKLIPSDEEFKQEFEIATVSKHKFARYYLSAIENYHRGKGNPELLVNTNPDSINLEHILPEKPGNNWSNFKEEDVRTYVKRIGNLTLMKTKENNDFKSSAFHIKKEKFKESALWITKMIAENYEEWNVENIKDRQNKLADLAVKTWSLNFD